MTADGPLNVRVNAVQQGTVPPYAYSVGLASIAGCELLCAGALRYNVNQVAFIIQSCASQIFEGSGSVPASVYVTDLGSFDLGPVHDNWLSALIPSQYYRGTSQAWRQLIPVVPAPTVDVPDLAVPPSDGRDPAWRWLGRDWDLSIPVDSRLVTTIDVLSGSAPVTIFRWESDQWEALDKPAKEIAHADARVAPIGILSAIVDDWESFLRLPVGQGLKCTAGNWVSA